MPNVKSWWIAVLFLLVSVGTAHSVNPDEVLDDPVLENRARALSVEIRCLVCQNQSIDDSDAQLARDLRVLVREKLVEGLTDEQVLDYLVARYGEFVLLKPRFNAGTSVLWIAPFAILVLSGIALFLYARRRQPVPVEKAALTEQEQNQLKKLLDGSD
ncbi:MAG: cytochrome c-type biogenesis protein [Pseudomonadota bacterium]